MLKRSGIGSIIIIVMLSSLLTSSWVEAQPILFFSSPIKLSANINRAAQAISYVLGIERIAYTKNDDTLSFYVQDLRGSVIKVSKVEDTGIDYRYQAYGETKSTAPSVNFFQYNDEPYDAHTHLLYLRARFYYPALKIFVNQDSDDLINKYSFVNGNPIMKKDYSGHYARQFLLPYAGAVHYFKNNQDFLAIFNILYSVSTTVAIMMIIVEGSIRLSGKIFSKRASKEAPNTQLAKKKCV
jgi:RHS repeat-associated protein